MDEWRENNQQLYNYTRIGEKDKKNIVKNFQQFIICKSVQKEAWQSLLLFANQWHDGCYLCHTNGKLRNK